MPQSRLQQLTLFVPELLWPDPNDRNVWDGLDCPSLALLFARGRASAGRPQAAETALVELFGHAADLACAPVRRLGEQGLSRDDVGRADWITADPVHLRFEQERLILAGGGALDIDEEEATALVDALNGHFPELGVFHAAAPDRWYLRLDDSPAKEALLRLAAPAPSAVIGRSVEGLLTELTEERELRRLLNEIQTVLHAHPVNQKRDMAGRATINSLWLWSGGGLPQPMDTGAAFDAVYSADALARGLARFGRIADFPPVNNADALVETTSARHALVVLDDLSGPVQYEDSARYRHTLLDLESRWFGPAWQALIDGRLGQLNLVAPCVFGQLSREARRSAKWRFWCSPKPLAHAVDLTMGDTFLDNKN